MVSFIYRFITAIFKVNQHLVIIITIIIIKVINFTISSFPNIHHLKIKS